MSGEERQDTPDGRSGLGATAQTLLAGCAGTGAFAAAYTLGGLVWWVALVPAVAATLATFVLVPRRREAAEVEVAAGVTLAELNRVVAHTQDTAQRFRVLAKRIRDRQVARAVDEIAGITQDIARNFQADPKDIRSAYDFLDYHLGKAFEVIDAYATLSTAARLSEAETAKLAEVGKTILEIQQLFHDHLVSLRADDVKALSHATEALKTIAFSLERPRKES